VFAIQRSAKTDANTKASVKASAKNTGAPKTTAASDAALREPEDEPGTQGPESAKF
jgi:hypothetical protein